MKPRVARLILLLDGRGKQIEESALLAGSLGFLG
jgi:hypothetical protein